MEFRGKSNGKKDTQNVDTTNCLLFYKDPPVEEITLEEFEEFAIDRLKLLREVENINIRFSRNSKDYNNLMRKILKEFLPISVKDQTTKDKVTGGYEGIQCDVKRQKQSKMIDSLGAQKKDHISHFILRLAFARSEDLRRWFLTQEIDLFRYRFQMLCDHKKMFMDQNNLKFELVEETEKEELIDRLQQSLFKLREREVLMKDNYYKVDFTDVLDLVKNRQVYLKQGKAYVPEEELVSIIIGIYRTNLSQALAITARKLPYLEEDARLLPMLRNLSSAYIGDSYSSMKNTNSDKLTLNKIDEVSKISYPVCMRNLHDGLRRDHHLKHFGRLQYGLFIKAAGLSLEEALVFWRTEFTKKMEVDKFEKQYAYNVRHSYGKEGKRADYTPYSCLKIITSNQPGTGDFHGCPFKHSDADALKKRLQSYKVPKENMNEILDLAKRQHYQIACARYFEVTHKHSEQTVTINHPNEYFEQSRRLLKEDSKTNTSLNQQANSKQEEKKISSNEIGELSGDLDLDEAMDILE